jgi:hypothetical protein
MSASAVQEYLHLLVQRHGWRELGKGYEYLGLHRGITVHAVECQGALALLFFSPHVKLAEGAAFQDFRNWAEAGLPAAWLQARPGDPHSCVLLIDGYRLREMGPSRCLLIPDLMARDFHVHGAAEEPPCARCGKAKATTAILIDGTYTAMCDPCRQEAQRNAAEGGKVAARPVRWSRVVPLLIGFSLAGAWLWGLVQQQIPGAAWLFLVPLIYGWIVSAVVLRSGTGTSLALRLALAASVLLVVLVGNIWAYQVVLASEKGGASWGEAVRQYFTTRLGEHLAQEVSYFIGGFLGAVLAVAWLREDKRARVR